MHLVVLRLRECDGIALVAGVRIDHVEIPLARIGGAMRKDDATIRGPRRRPLIAGKRRDPLWGSAASRDDEEIEPVAGVGSKGEATAVGGPCRLALDAGGACQLARLTPVGKHRVDAIEKDDGEVLAVGRPGRFAHTGHTGLRGWFQGECGQQQRASNQSAQPPSTDHYPPTTADTMCRAEMP
jgi:hypothetical protein